MQTLKKFMAVLGILTTLAVGPAGASASAKGDDSLVLPAGVSIVEGEIQTSDGEPLTKEQIEFMNSRSAGCFAYAQAWTTSWGVAGRGHKLGTNCSGYLICATMFSSLTGFEVDDEKCSSSSSKSPRVEYNCGNPECGIVRALLYEGSGSGTLVDFHTAADQPCP